MDSTNDELTKSDFIDINKEVILIKLDNDFAEMRLTLDQNIYNAGDTVKGLILLNLKKEFPSSCIKFVLKGEEQCS